MDNHPIRLLKHSFNLPVTIVRPFNTFGPRQSPRAVIPTIITQMLAGNVVKLGSLDTIRDFNFVKDTVNGFINIARNSNCEGEVINIGSGRGYSIKELFIIINSIIKKDVRLLIDNKRIRPAKSEVKALICNYKKAKKIVKYEPEYTLRQGLLETIEYFKRAKKTGKEAAYII